MSSQPTPAQPPGITLGDIYYVLFRHKWKIVLCTLAGIAVAATLYSLESATYRSEAKLFVRYIISATSNTGPNSDATAKLPDEHGASIMNTEREILNSLDLIEQVVKAITPEKILAKAGGGANPNQAVAMLQKNLSVTVPPASSVIHIAVKHPDSEIVQPILRELIARYLLMHYESHRAAGMLGNTLQAGADDLRSKLNITENDLREETAKAGIISLEDAKKEIGSEMAAIRRELRNYEVEIAMRLALIKNYGSNPPVSATPAPLELRPPLPAGIIAQYRNLTSRVERLQKEEEAFLSQFSPENLRVKDVRARLAEAEGERKVLEDQHPGLKEQGAPAIAQNGPGPEAVAFANATQQVTAFQARVAVLKTQLDQLQERLRALDRAEGRITELTRRKERDEKHYSYYQTRSDQARINEALGTGKVSNIISIQDPSQAFREPLNKKVGMPAFAGVLIGVGWAFLIELFLDRSVRRPSDIEKTLRVPLLLSIPKMRVSSDGSRLSEARKQLALASSEAKSGSDDDNTRIISRHRDPDALLAPFHETLRDRLISYFETKNLTHKPKLVAITGLGRHAGVTTTAGGLARSLSETGEGNVLLVDMTVGQGAAQQFVKGKAVCGLDELLSARDQAQVDTNLFVVAENSNSDRLSRNLPQRFTKLVPQLKSSDFDYVIFDMPPVSQLSITTRLASFMDMVLLVVESEKNDRDIVQQATALLAESKAHVGIILNKTKSYVPERLNQEYLNS